MSEHISTFSPGNDSVQFGRVGGYMGMAGAIIAMLIFIAGCFGYQQVFSIMPYVPMLLGSVGMLLSLAAGFKLVDNGLDDTQTFMAIFTCFIAMGGAFLELAVGNHWTIFYTAPAN